ncbi:S8 family peptidase [Bradyrhizobium sp. INPA03-11B]|uniref:S8 family peptidase n=1 Tax=Bradyrhizobium sp. INPA03-11B TaxID=418598 RepID=UPI00338D5731
MEAPVLPNRPRLLMERATIPPALDDADRRAEWKLPEADKPGKYMIELNIMHEAGVVGAAAGFMELYKALGLPSAHDPKQISKSYYSCFVSLVDLRRLVRSDEDAAANNPAKLSIYKVWPDFPVRATLDRSITTVKADAAARTFAASGEGIVWAVIDSGVDARHAHFQANETLDHPSVVQLHRNFTTALQGESALTDEYGHGTHVAGIIAGGLTTDDPEQYAVYQRTYDTDANGQPSTVIKRRRLKKGDKLTGVAPLCRLVSLKILDEGGEGNVSDIIAALTYVRESVNGDPKLLRIHGVNLSVGYDFDPEMFGCGQSPLCVEVNRLVNSGVVVVAAAGNTGYGALTAGNRQTSAGYLNTINDPGNADLAITVGSTHRDSPHTYGISYFSSKGPTGDGRLKPDLVAPGERITSCAAGKYLASRGGSVPDEIPGYIDETGTSMAAPHVSGAVAAFLSIRREFIQNPLRVKKIFLETATCLGRERYFQGNGLVDLMRAIQSV